MKGEEDTAEETTRRGRRRVASRTGSERPRANAADDATSPSRSSSTWTPPSPMTGLTSAFADTEMASITGTRGATTSSSVTTTRRQRLTTSEGVREVRELDAMMLLLGAMIAFPLISVPVLEYFTDGTRNDRMFVYGALLVVALNALGMFFRVRRLQTFPRDGISATHAILIGVAISFLILGLGMCTAATGVIALGIVVLSSNSSSQHGAAAYLVISVGHAIIVGLALAGIVTTTGLGDVVPTPHGDLLLSGLFVVGEYTAAYLLGLLVSRRWAALVAELADAMREVADREAMLREVRAELDRAANQVGRASRFTGHEFGSFRVGNLLGRGGMGDVYEAVRIRDGAEAAIKFLQRGMLGDAELVRRFEREARAVASVVSPHVTAVLEVGGPTSPVPYLALERLHGTDLASMLRQRKTLPLDMVVTLVREVAAGLAVAHAAGLVHRDLKPGNLFHAIDGHRRIWKILDFGIAKQTTPGDATLTGNQLVGTPHYMAPEQASGLRAIDARADLHALAAIAYRALTGKPLFSHDDVARLLVAVANEVPRDPTEFVALPPDVVLVLRAGLAKSPDDRPADVTSFAEAFESAATGELASERRAVAESFAAREPWGSRIDAMSVGAG